MYTYFAEIEIPDRVTIYDELLLSLRRKDFVATFNWDRCWSKHIAATRTFASFHKWPTLAAGIVYLSTLAH